MQAIRALRRDLGGARTGDRVLLRPTGFSSEAGVQQSRLICDQPVMNGPLFRGFASEPLELLDVTAARLDGVRPYGRRLRSMRTKPAGASGSFPTGCGCSPTWR